MRALVLFILLENNKDNVFILARKEDESKK